MEAHETGASEAWIDAAAVEAAILQIWSELLHVDDVKPEDDFFVLGGDSLTAVQLMMEVDARFGICFDPVEIIDKPTAKAFSDIVVQILRS